MGDAPYGDTYHRWDWFRRSQWWASFRNSGQIRRWRATLGIIGDPTGKIVLDATCGLGRKTLVLSDLDMNVSGSDASSYAVEHARELASSEDRGIDFFVSTWRELPERMPHPFDAIFVDAFVECCETYEDLLASLSGIAAALKDGGVFIFSGLEPGKKMTEILEFTWNCGERFCIAWQHREEDCECTCLDVMCRGDDFIDDHYLYLIKERDVEVRLESWTMRRWFKWDWDCIDAAARRAGFSSVQTEWFEEPGTEGSTFPRTVARK